MQVHPGRQTVGQQSWVTGGASYPWPLHQWGAANGIKPADGLTGSARPEMNTATDSAPRREGRSASQAPEQGLDDRDIAE